MRIDYIIKDAQVYLTFLQSFEKRDVAVSGERIFAVSPKFADGAVRTVDGSGMYLIPGLIDIHMHIESSMTYPKEFSRLALKHGTTTVVADAHEIANVFGMEGIRSFLDQKTELDIFYAIPSSVPATSWELETPGAAIGEEEAAQMLEDPRVLCLGEVMNFKDLVPDDLERSDGPSAEAETSGSVGVAAAAGTKTLRLIQMCRSRRGRDIRIEGHCPKISGMDLNRFIFAGVDADHTQQTPESVLEKSELGMFLELQKKSLTPEVVEAVCSHSLYENVALITDDTMPDQLLEGQMNRILRTAVEAGMPVEKAIYCATYTPARRMHLDDRGMIGPGKLADFLLLKDLETFRPAAVVKSGRLVSGSWIVTENAAADAEKGAEEKAAEEKSDAENRQTGGKDAKTRMAAGTQFPPYFYHSVRCRDAVPSDFILRTGASCSSALVNVIRIAAFGTATELVRRRLPVKDGEICWQEAGLCLAVIYERHGRNGNIAVGLVEGAFRKPGAAATTWSHDSHNLLVLGNSTEDMMIAQKRVISLQGGYVVAAKGAVAAEAGLPVAGIISDAPLEKLAEDMGRVRAAMAALGYRNNNEIMSMSTLALPVSPALKLTDYGLLDVKTQKKVELIAEEC